MKNYSLTVAITLFSLFSISAKAQSKSSSSNDNIILSFEVGNVQKSNAILVIKNSAGQVVRSKSFTTNYCNVDKSIFVAGTYTYSILNGGKAVQGNFTIK